MLAHVCLALLDSRILPAANVLAHAVVCFALLGADPKINGT